MVQLVQLHHASSLCNFPEPRLTALLHPSFGRLQGWGNTYQRCRRSARTCHWPNNGFDCAAYEDALLARIQRDVAQYKGSFATYDGARRQQHHLLGMLGLKTSLWRPKPQTLNSRLLCLHSTPIRERHVHGLVG